MEGRDGLNWWMCGRQGERVAGKVEEKSPAKAKQSIESQKQRNKIKRNRNKNKKDKRNE